MGLHTGYPKNPVVFFDRRPEREPKRRKGELDLDNMRGTQSLWLSLDSVDDRNPA